MRLMISFVLIAAAGLATIAADDSRQAFVANWEGTHVVVRRTLYTLVYNEHGRVTSVSRDRREGLTVATPFAGTYFRFDGRQARGDITGADPQALMDLIARAYQSTHVLDIGTSQRIEPVLLARYEPGVELLVKSAKIERDRVRLILVENGEGSDRSNGDPATTLTVQWPVNLSRSFEERGEVEKLLAEYLAFVPRSAAAVR